MQQWQLPALGHENLQLVQVPIPEPGQGQVLVRVHAASLNYRDLLILRDGMGMGPALPLVPGSDMAGEVVAIGPGVAEFGRRTIRHAELPIRQRQVEAGHPLGPAPVQGRWIGEASFQLLAGRAVIAVLAEADAQDDRAAIEFPGAIAGVGDGFGRVADRGVGAHASVPREQQERVRALRAFEQRLQDRDRLSGIDFKIDAGESGPAISDDRRVLKVYEGLCHRKAT